ncbi:MAG: hypothetical protein OXH72_11840 [Caldilineaceae bacterium]|nr:hypothetical protein [Caldilineaceae bacterium]
MRSLSIRSWRSLKPIPIVTIDITSLQILAFGNERQGWNDPEPDALAAYIVAESL